LIGRRARSLSIPQPLFVLNEPVWHFQLGEKRIGFENVPDVRENRFAHLQIRFVVHWIVLFGAADHDGVLPGKEVLREQFSILHRRLLAIVRDDEVCRRLMTVPGVGPVVALTYRATVDVPARFRNSKAVGAAFGLTPSKYQSGQINRTGAISKCGDEMMRVMLYEAAQIMLVRLAKWSWLKAWAMKIARHRGMKKAIVALARRLAVIMHRIWVDGTEFQWTREVTAA
jgi:hypothetical protein